MNRLPDHFKPLFWSYRFDTLDAQKHKKTILVQTINYGSWKQWKWLADTYGTEEMREALATIPATEFRARALMLARIVFGVTKKTYAHRSTH